MGVTGSERAINNHYLRRLRRLLELRDTMPVPRTVYDPGDRAYRAQITPARKLVNDQILSTYLLLVERGQGEEANRVLGKKGEEEIAF